MDNPQLVAVAGPNGAGKSTLASRLLPEEFRLYDYVNADTIARGLSAYNPESVAVQAGRVMLGRLDELAIARVSFAFETTLSGRAYANWIRELKDHGYVFHLFFVALRKTELSIERVKNRVRLGGHNVPDDLPAQGYVQQRCRVDCQDDGEQESQPEGPRFGDSDGAILHQPRRQGTIRIAEARTREGEEDPARDESKNEMTIAARDPLCSVEGTAKTPRTPRGEGLTTVAVVCSRRLLIPAY
jgi:predicted ABC-type ATPase